MKGLGMRFCALFGALFLLSGCGQKQAPVKDYWDEENRLQQFQGALHELRDLGKKPGSFALQDGKSDFSDFLRLSIGAGKTFLDNHGGSENAPVVKEVLAQVEEIEASKPTAPSPELTTKLEGMVEKSSKLKMREMTAEEKASVKHSIK